WLPAVALIAALLSCGLAAPDGSSRLPASILYTGIFASVANLIFEMFFVTPSVHILDLAHFMGLLCCCKFFDLRTNRDIGLMAVIAFLLLVIGALVSGTLVFAAAVIVDATLGVWWLVTFHVRYQTESILNRRRAAIPGRLADFGVTEQVDGVTRRSRHLGVVAASAAGMVAVSAVLFVAVPRGLGGSLFGKIRQVVAAPITGFTDQVVLGDSGLFQSSAPVMRVRVTRGDRVLDDGEYEPYLRGATQEVYTNGAWQRTPAQSFIYEYRLNGGATVPLTSANFSDRSDSILSQEVWLDDIGPYLFAEYPPIAISSGDFVVIERDADNWSLRLKYVPDDAGHYVVFSLMDVDAGAADALARETVPRVPSRGFASKIPKNLEQFAIELAGRYGDPTLPEDHEAIARGIESFLQSEPFTYSLEGGGDRPIGRDPVEHFLLDSRRGHCEYFASAMTLVCQANGISARLVSGYYGGEFEADKGHFQIRRKDAHAWVEVRLPDRGWVKFDPSPPRESGDASAGFGLLGDLKDLYETLQLKWSAFVVAFDSDIRDELVGHFGRWFLNLKEGGQGAQSFWRAAKSLIWGPEFLSAGQRLLYWVVLCLWIALALLLMRTLWIVLLMIRAYLPAPKTSTSTLVRRPEARFYDHLLMLLAGKGYKKTPEATPREFAGRLVRAHPDLSEVGEITEWFYAAQFGRIGLASDRRRRLKKFLKRLREEPSFGVGRINSKQ
ncbi:MAG: DUF3488 and transglutaminase-like domain-containing protein, partial [Planctomycetota bacterium]|nr:DUF3488 and transglutaminase-like domain-containing protein [Planctomycetota bacterium]